MSASHCATTRPYTVALCISCATEPNVAVLQHLRRSVRRCAHGVLVTTGCLRGTISCVTRPHGSGAIVVMQPCSLDRAPNGPTLWIGPITDGDDVKAVCAWLERGEWDLNELPDRLHTARNGVAEVSQRN